MRPFQVALDKGIPENQLYEVKSAHVSALATHGRITDALEVYDETKKARCSLDPKAVLSIIVSSITHTLTLFAF